MTPSGIIFHDRLDRKGIHGNINAGLEISSMDGEPRLLQNLFSYTGSICTNCTASDGIASSSFASP